MAKRSTPSSNPAAKTGAQAPAAPAEQQGDLPADPNTDAAALGTPGVTGGTEPPSEPAPGANAAPTVVESTARTTGQDAQPVITLDDPDIANYLTLLQGAGENLDGLIPLSMLSESQLRQVGQFVEVEGFAELPPEQLAIQIEAKVGIGAVVTPAPSTGDPDTAPAAPDTAAATKQPASAAPQAYVGDAVVTQPGGELQSAASPASGSATDAVVGLGDDGDIEGLWVMAIPEQGFRRCGFRFTHEGIGIALGALTAEQIEALENEPNLKVERGIFGGRVEGQ